MRKRFQGFQFDIEQIGTPYSFKERNRSLTLFSGIPLDYKQDIWALTGERNNIDMRRLDKLTISNIEHDDVRYALALLATKRPYGSIIKFVSGITTSNITSLDKTGVIQLKEISKSSIDSLVAVAKQLNLMDSSYEDFLVEILKINPPQIKRPKIYDVQVGALSEYEHTDFTDKLNKFSDKLSSDWVDKIYGIDSTLDSWERLIIARFMTIFSRRPSQLSQCKWSDFTPVNTDLGIEFDLLMPMAKQGDEFRVVFEVYPLRLLHNLSTELFKYRALYTRQLKRVLASNNINMSGPKLNKFMLDLPLFATRKLFNAEFSNPNQFFNSFHNKSNFFHRQSDNIKSRFARIIEVLKPESDRISPENYKIGNNRLRHTTGTSLAEQGYDAIVIAKALGNTAGSARHYVDMSDEIRASINDAFEAQSLLEKSFSGKLTSEIRSEDISIYDLNYGELGKSTNSNHCMTCNEARPIGCYGCNMFRPLISADHESKLNEVKILYKNRLESGNAHIALSGLRRTIKKIEITISACFRAQKTISKV
jgi:hypothetical protein